MGRSRRRESLYHIVVLSYSVMLLAAFPDARAQSSNDDGASRESRWVQFAQTARLRAYYQPPQVTAPHPLVPVRFDYLVKQVSPQGRRYQSQVGQQEMDCDAARSRSTSFRWHALRGGQGAVVYVHDSVSPWEAYRPGSLGSQLATLVCGTEDRARFESKASQDAYVGATLRKYAAQLNAQTPVRVDEITQMMGVVALDKTVTFNMMLDGDWRGVDSARVAAEVRQNLNRTVCSNQATRTLFDAGVRFVYLYMGRDGRLISRVVIERYAC